MNMKIVATIIFIIGIFFSGNAQSLVYKPINPAFGGDTFNYQWLLSSAESQNKFKETQDLSFGQQSELERFKENLNSQILNQVSSSLFQTQFGTDGLTEGSYVFGSLSIDIYRSNLGLVVDILDTDTGEQSQVIVPGN
ncbi:curli production assembly/transport component CsgF [Flavobacterium degerlachei]|uniref:Curli production assembly/transport component CsgF n=2 Tax=Flavobacterium degerlachei TaxID=229203 RepID=A0A1H2TDV1_9FLAO|nr:curli production assembly/transport component CsgF [Flavobacterium degerlachei]